MFPILNGRKLEINRGTLSLTCLVLFHVLSFEQFKGSHQGGGGVAGQWNHSKHANTSVAAVRAAW